MRKREINRIVKIIGLLIFVIVIPFIIVLRGHGSFVAHIIISFIFGMMVVNMYFMAKLTHNWQSTYKIIARLFMTLIGIGLPLLGAYASFSGELQTDIPLIVSISYMFLLAVLMLKFKKRY